MTPVVFTFVQAAVGLGLVVYALVLVVQQLQTVKWRMPKPFRRGAGDDLRVIVDMAARFRDAGNTQAVAACQALIDELLNPTKPQAPASPRLVVDPATVMPT